MKSNLNIIFFLVVTTFFLIMSSCEDQIESGADTNLIVLVKFKALPSKSTDAINGLTKLIENVRHEPHFVSIKVHIDSKEPSNILLYEEWSDASYYNSAHMNTPHLLQFREESQLFLAGPPEITQWRVEKVFTAE
ncbi:MAG: antibiotic biosynthesis monooxygenase [Bacteroidales bacterium]|nr:antibiotic biosynthesis monooxygenase [Bacteroidales bacterium]